MPDHAALIIRGGQVLAGGRLHNMDLVSRDGVIAEIGEHLSAPGAKEIDASGCVVGPGLVDIHTHLREPGREEAETIETGTRAAALGGYTAVVAMPNTEPTIDTVEVVRSIQSIAVTAMCHVSVAGSITVDRAGERLSPMAEMAALGVTLFTDDGGGVQDARLMRRALEYSKSLGVTLAQHCEDSCLSAGGQMHEGEVSSKLGISATPAEAEEVMVMRDIALARMVGVPMHFLHLSTAGSVELVRAAKAAGMPITSEAAPHHFTLTDNEITSFDPVFKVNPPLRSARHRDAVKQGLIDGTVDAIATDHAPHAPHLKELPFNDAPCGMLGLETAVSLALSELGVTPERVFELMSTAPARIARLQDHHGSLEVGRAANICVIDPAAQWVVDPAALSSKSANTPFAGRKMTGRVRHTIFQGEVTVSDGVATR